MCPGVLCNSQCPDELRLGELTSNKWHTGLKIFIALLIVIPAVGCIIIKVLFRLWLLQLEKKQEEYLKQQQLLDRKARNSSIKVECLSMCCSVPQWLRATCWNGHRVARATSAQNTHNNRNRYVQTSLLARGYDAITRVYNV